MRRLTETIVVRIEPALLEALRADAAENGRTVAQSARFHLTRALGAPDDGGGS